MVLWSKIDYFLLDLPMINQKKDHYFRGWRREKDPGYLGSTIFLRANSNPGQQEEEQGRKWALMDQEFHLR